ncbi:hypothetical protein G5V59_18940 [Nocardioides sp. W3-2-3]|uniref:hypothetical protein n=1 Tax=Nocardioides convexus TaxID=2712224 RepID=UPI00241832B3|nr:hypothetical protein [Nocardioides convexus]NHA01229.1 hypothetical protein [Nocardioides convexus]
MTSDALEEWHRYCLTAFTDRMRNRLRAHCDDEHKSLAGQAPPQRAPGRREAPATREHLRLRHRRPTRQQAGTRTAAGPGRPTEARPGRPRHRRDPRRRRTRRAAAHPHREGTT